jgi:hypothetical protein
MFMIELTDLFILVNNLIGNVKKMPFHNYTDLHATETLAREFPHVENGAALLKSMQSQPSFQLGTPSADVIAFLERAEHADPNSPDISEDDKGESWGHHQLAGSSPLLDSWHNICNTGIACRLIAVAIKTCQVARHLCFVKQIKPSAYLCDIYLSKIVDSLWGSWKQAVGINVSDIYISRLLAHTHLFTACIIRSAKRHPPSRHPTRPNLTTT